MKTLSATMREEALKDLTMYFGEPPYDMDDVRRHRSSGLFEQQALMKFGKTPIELIKELQEVPLSEKTKAEAIKDLTMYYGEQPVPKNIIEKRLSSGLLEMQILAKYSMTVNSLMKEVGFEVSR